MFIIQVLETGGRPKVGHGSKNSHTLYMKALQGGSEQFAYGFTAKNQATGIKQLSVKF